MTDCKNSQSLPELELGTIVLTPAIADLLNHSEIVGLLQHHQSGDWGNFGHINSVKLTIQEVIERRLEIEETDELNLLALVVQDGSILSEFMVRNTPVWIYTNINARQVITTVLMPSEF